VPGLVAGLPPSLKDDLKVINGLLEGDSVDEDVLREILSPAFLALAAVASLALILCCCLTLIICGRICWCCCCRSKKKERDKGQYQPPASQKVELKYAALPIITEKFRKQPASIWTSCLPINATIRLARSSIQNWKSWNSPATTSSTCETSDKARSGACSRPKRRDLFPERSSLWWPSRC